MSALTRSCPPRDNINWRLRSLSLTEHSLSSQASRNLKFHLSARVCNFYATLKMSGCGNPGCPCGASCNCSSGCSCGCKRSMDVAIDMAVEGDCNDCKCGANCACANCSCHK
ncbi:hypothetical protein Mapa_002665 [Marchantia paleacea]|nr:hypothetical protein Mapa_002665 [Marchantia paleacea]